MLEREAVHEKEGMGFEGRRRSPARPAKEKASGERCRCGTAGLGKMLQNPG